MPWVVVRPRPLVHRRDGTWKAPTGRSLWDGYKDSAAADLEMVPAGCLRSVEKIKHPSPLRSQAGSLRGGPVWAVSGILTHGNT